MPWVPLSIYRCVQKPGHHPKATAEVVPFMRDSAVPAGATHVPSDTPERPAAQPCGSRRPARSGSPAHPLHRTDSQTQACTLLAPQTARPFPHVARHVQQAIRALSARIPAHRRRVTHGLLKLQIPLFGSRSPQGQMRPSVPRAALSHSASDGSRTPTHLQNAIVSCHETQVTGWSCFARTSLSGPRGCAQLGPSISFHSDPVHVEPCDSAAVRYPGLAAMNAANCATVTGKARDAVLRQVPRAAAAHRPRPACPSSYRCPSGSRRRE